MFSILSFSLVYYNILGLFVVVAASKQSSIAFSWSIIRGGLVPEPPKPPSTPVKPASIEAKLGRPRICLRKSSLVASDGLLAMRWNSLSRTRPSRGDTCWRVTSFKEHLQREREREREREFCFALLFFAWI